MVRAAGPASRGPLRHRAGGGGCDGKTHRDMVRCQPGRRGRKGRRGGFHRLFMPASMLPAGSGLHRDRGAAASHAFP
ncbi:Hypothetical protein RMHFA_05692 [Roseomonas mucosa]|nr:Hypothetical protein RMHFA_05692 [Roseomonas mucosa]